MTVSSHSYSGSPFDGSLRNQRLSSRQRGILASGLSAAALGTLVLLGWLLDIPVLRRGSLGLPATPPWAACGLILCGLALVLSLRSGNFAHRLARSLTLLTLGITGLAALHVLPGIDWGLGGLLFGSAAARAGPASLIPSSSVDLVCFALLGVALLCVRAREPISRGAFITAATAGALLIAASLLSYLFNVELIRGTVVSSLIGLHAGLGLAALFAAVLTLRADIGWVRLLTENSVGAMSSRRLLVWSVGLLVGFAALVHVGTNVALYRAEFEIAFMTLGGITLLFAALLVNASRLNRLDEERRRHETDLRLALRASQMVAFTCDLRNWKVWQIRHSSSSAHEDILTERITSYDGYLRLVHPDDRERFDACIKRAVAERRRHYEQEYRIRRAGGEVIWLREQGEVTYDAAGEPLELVGIALDITDRKIAEEELLKSRRQLQFVTDDAPVLLAYCGSDYRFRFVNKAYAQRFGKHPRDLVGHTIAAVLGERAFDQILPFIERVLGGERVEFETEVHYRDLGPQWMHCAYAPEHDETGRVTGWVAALINVTEIKRAERERTELLAREHEARREAEAASRAKDEFLATVSHELRSPLNAILGWAHLLKVRRADESEQQRALETIVRNAKAQAKIIDDILDVSRIISGKLQLSVRPVNLRPLITGAIEAVRPAAEAKGIRLERQFEPFEEPVLGDPDRLQQVFWNLLSNAIKFTPSGGSVTVRLARRGAHHEIEVSDTGQGISGEFLPYVFDRFRQADGSYSRRHGGLGLGLSIVRHLVEMHGGIAEAESPGTGQGATFRIKLPLVRTWASRAEGIIDTPSRHAAGAAEAQSAALTAALRGLKILIVDDEPDTLELLHLWLLQCGAEPRGAGSVREALEILNGWVPDLLISDIGMPGEDGLSLIRRIRNLSSRDLRNLPAIALTAYVTAEERSHTVEAGYQRHVSKPVEFSQLIDTIVELIGRRESRSATPLA